MLTVTPAIFAFLAVIVHGIPVSPISNLDFVEDRARAEAGRLRFFSANSSVKLVDHALARRSNVHSGWWSVATGDRCGPNSIRFVDCSGKIKDVPGEGRRFYSKGKTSSICRLSMDSGQWPVSHSDPEDYVIITVLMRGSPTAGKNAYFTIREPSCVGVTESCDEVDLEIYAPVYGADYDTGAVPNAFKRDSVNRWLPEKFVTQNDPTQTFYAYTMYIHDRFMSVAVSDVNGIKKDIRECAGDSDCPFSPENLVGAFVGIWDCGGSDPLDYCGLSVPDESYMVVKEIYWEQYF